jgi:hypothetical protein
MGVGVAMVSVCLLAASLGASPTQAATAEDPMAFGFFAGGTTPSKVQAVDFKITSSASATNAFKTMANDPFDSGSIT